MPEGGVRFARRAGYANSRFGSFQIVVDGAVRGKIRAAHVVDLALPVGPHVVQVRVSRFWRSPTLRICVEPDTILSLECYPAYAIGRGALRFGDYLVLEQNSLG